MTNARVDQFKGHVKEVAGRVMGNEDMEAEGKKDRLAGDRKETIGKASEKVKTIVDDAEAKVENVVDKVKEAS